MKDNSMRIGQNY